MKPNKVETVAVRKMSPSGIVMSLVALGMRNQYPIRTNGTRGSCLTQN